MQLTPEHIVHINAKFAEMSGKEDFVDLLNYAKNIVVGEKSHPFELKQITYYANPKVSGRRYKKFEIKKKSGGIRTIHSPVKGLSVIQRCLNLILQCVFTPHDAAKGFVQGKSIVDNAKMHVGRNYVYNIDLKDFFPSIDQARIWKCLQLAPFNLVDKTPPKMVTKEEQKQHNLELLKMLIEGARLLPGQTRETIFAQMKESSEKRAAFLKDKVYSRLLIANIIASLACTSMDVERMDKDGNWQIVKRNVLPQGAATSPVITNIVCQRLDYLLTGVAKRFGLKYSRYADDITFSSQHNIFKDDGEFIKELRRIIAEQGFHIKESKVRLQQAAYRQEVTGLIVNKTVNVSQNYIKQLRMWLYNWERYGYDRAYSYFIPSYLAGKTTPVRGKPDMANVIGGKLNYLKMVKGENNEMYLKLKGRFLALVANYLSINSILDIWEKDGIDIAMDVYYKQENSISLTDE